MKKLKPYRIKDILKNRVLWVIIGVLFCTIIFLPYIGILYNKLVFESKVDTSNFNISRLELLKIYLSLVGPTLTFLLFRNTLSLQEENRKKYKEDKDVAIKRKHVDDANREFFILLQLFVNQQVTVQNNKTIHNLFSKAIFNEEGYGFINYYSPESNKEDVVNDSTEIKRSSGPFFGDATCYTSKVNSTIGDISVEIINEQYASVQAHIGPYLKILYQIIKNLNHRLENDRLPFEDYINFIDILISHLSSEEFIIILFSSIYVERCLKLGVELIGTNFFGDQLDFEKEQNFEIPKDRVQITDILAFEATHANLEKRIELRKRMRSTDAFNLNMLMHRENYCRIR